MPTGYVSRKGRSLQLNWVTFNRISDGAPVLLHWLCTRGGSGFKYDLVSGSGFDPDDAP